MPAIPAAAMYDLSTRDAASHIFSRPLLYVAPNDDLVHTATFLAIGPQIYAGGLVVLNGDRLVGRIGGWHLASHILEKKERGFMGMQASLLNIFL